jgi:hypothetical protein
MPFLVLYLLTDARIIECLGYRAVRRPNHFPADLMGSGPLYNKFIPRCFCYFFRFFFFFFTFSLLISARPEN